MPLIYSWALLLLDRPLAISHPGERGGHGRERMINHTQIPPETPGLSGWMYESSWGVLVEISPLSSIWIVERNPPMKDMLLWKWAAKLLEKKTEVMSICSKLWTLTWTPMGAIWSRQWNYGVGGGSVWTSSEAKPSLTHSRDSWETHPTSKQTYWEREHRAAPSQLSHGGQLTWSEWCSETSAPTCWNMTWIHAVILPLIPLWLHSKQTDNSLIPPTPSPLPPRHGNPIWG